MHADGRKHLLSPPGSLSRLAEAVAPEGSLAQFDDHYLCGEKPLVEAEVLKLKLALAAVSWMAPRSLRNSMESWRASGLLDIADERMIFLNSPTPEDFAIAAEFEFDVYTTDEHDGNISAWRASGAQGTWAVPPDGALPPLLLPLPGGSGGAEHRIPRWQLDRRRDPLPREGLRRQLDARGYVARDVERHAAPIQGRRGVQVRCQRASGLRAPACTPPFCRRLRGNTDYPAEGMPDCCTPKQP